MSSEQFFQLEFAPRPFSRSHVMRFLTMKCFSRIVCTDFDDCQSQQTYSEALVFRHRFSFAIHVSSQSSYSSDDVFENVLLPNFLVKLYGGSTIKRSMN